MEASLIQAFWATFFMVAAQALAPEPDRPEDAKASKLGDVDAPTISEGTTVPVVIGSVLLSAAGAYPNGTWTLTVRVRNQTSGIVIAQGDLVLTFGPDPVEDPHG